MASIPQRCPGGVRVLLSSGFRVCYIAIVDCWALPMVGFRTPLIALCLWRPSDSERWPDCLIGGKRRSSVAICFPAIL